MESDKRVMNTVSTCVWYGESGKSYEYQIFSVESIFRDVGGNYILCDRDVMGDWDPLFIGEATNLFQHLGDSERQQWIRMQGVTHVHAHIGRDESQRLEESQDLLARFSPALNQTLYW